MRILTRYILKEVASHSLVGLLVFTFVIYIRYLGHVLELVVRHDIKPSAVFTLFLLPIPSILVLTIPMAVVVGTLIGLGRMAADGEVIAARASGVGLGQFVRPVMIYALVGWGLTGWMSLFLAPQAARKLVRLEIELRTSQAPYEIRPRVFIEQFPSLLLYLADIRGSRSEWHGVFIADKKQHDVSKVTLANRGILVNANRDQPMTLHLERGATHEFDPRKPEQYSVTSFTATDIPIPTDQAVPTSERRTPPLLPLASLLEMVRQPSGRPAGEVDIPPGALSGPALKPQVASPAERPLNETQRRAALIELHYRLALPAASLVLALVGIPLGLYTRKGGKAVGVVLAILLVFLYYILMAFGRSFAIQGRLDPGAGLWLANAVFGTAGVLMLLRVGAVRMRIQFVQDWLADLSRRWAAAVAGFRGGGVTPNNVLLRPRPAGSRFFQILDVYIIRQWFFYFVLMVLVFTGIYFIFDFFQLLGDIIRNHVRPLTVLDYYRYLAPQVLFFPAVPFGALVATLVSFGLLNRSNQITAIKSAGISLFRTAVPIFAAAVALSVGLFLLEDNYLPGLNQRQDAYRNQIKGKPAQTYFRPDLQWIFGESNRIFNYRFFDPDRAVFANFSVLEFDPKAYRITRRIYASRAFWEPHIKEWVLENGWMRKLEGDRVTEYMPFSVAAFNEIREPPSYFAREVKTSEQMSAWELRRYIGELSQSGFDVVRLSVQLYRKFAFPLIALVVTLIAVPFSLMGKSKGPVSGVALSMGIAIVYWSASNLFEEMGNLHQLPPSVAAWSPDILFGLGGAYLLLRVRT
jgi:LPS export ABC transporter permease LptF/LPS export ABC transporter permease LptG